MKTLSLGYPEISEKRIEEGTRILLLAEGLRILERSWHVIGIQDRWPELAMDGLPLLQSPIEIWDPVYYHSASVLGLLLCALAWIFSGKKRVAALGSLLLFNVFLAPGGTSIAKSLVLLQPAILAFLVLSLKDGRRFFVPLWILGTLYGFNGVSKYGPEWRDGSAVSLFLTSTLWSIGLPTAPAGIFWKLLNYATLAWEYAGFLLLLPVRSLRVQQFRLGYFAVALVFHVTLFVLSPFRVLSLAALSLWWAILPEKIHPLQETEPAPATRKDSLLLVFWISWLLLSNLNHFGIDIGRGPKTFFSRLSLYPSWALFSPSPHSGSVLAVLREPGRPAMVFHERPEISLLIDAYRFPEMWEYFSQRICEGKTGTVRLTIERKGISDPERTWICAP